MMGGDVDDQGTLCAYMSHGAVDPTTRPLTSHSHVRDGVLKPCIFPHALALGLPSTAHDPGCTRKSWVVMQVLWEAASSKEKTTTAVGAAVGAAVGGGV